MKTKFGFFVLLIAGCACRLPAQTLDSSGDSLLNGSYYLRQVFYAYSNQTAGVVDPISIQGNITFNGAGGWSFSGTYMNSTLTPPSGTLDSSGTYVISGSGQGYISAVYSTVSMDNIVGMVSNGIFMGSTTETGLSYNDLLIAVPIGSQNATNSTLNGAYTLAYFDPTVPGDALLTMTANGSGSIGTVNATEYIGTSTSSTTQTLSGVTYSFQNGAGVVKFGGKRTSSSMLAGTEYLYISPDGNFVAGGSPTGYDMFVGVRSATSPPSNFSGLYYQAGLNMDEAGLSVGTSPLDSYYGAFQVLPAVSSGPVLSANLIGHQRFSTSSVLSYRNLNSLLIYGGASDFTYYDAYTINSDGSSSDTAFGQHYVSTSDGTVRVGYGIGPTLGINVALQAPSFSGSGVYLNPAGIVNAASSAPYSAQVAAGEFLTLYGSGLANSTASATLPFPTKFQGVQVFINQTPAPIYYVSPTQISVVVPYTLAAGTVAQIYVNNNGESSNLVSGFTGESAVGVFTNDPVGGLGRAAALHPDYSTISESSPAQVGETVAVYLTGMGSVSPQVQDGAAAPTGPLSITTATPLVYLLDSAGNYVQAKVAFSGLAPGYAGLYQINFTVPSGIVSGDASLEIVGPDSATFEAILPVSASE